MSQRTSDRIIAALLFWAAFGHVVRADMFQDGSNAKLPEARSGLGIASISPKDYGAVCDGTSHPLSSKYATLVAAQADYPSALALINEIDGLAINRAFDRARVIAGSGVYITGGQGDCLADVSINATRLTGQNTVVDFSGMRIVTTAAGKIAFDAIGTDRVNWTGITVVSPGEATAPAVGFQMGRGGSGQAGSGGLVAKLNITGAFTKASCINFAGENTVFLKSVCHNSQPVAAFTGSISGTTLTASAVTNTLRVGMAVRSTSFPTGAGYTAGDLLTVTGGTCTAQPVIRVDEVLKGGEISTWSIPTPGSCTVEPAPPYTLTGGTGSGAQLRGAFTPASLTAIDVLVPGKGYTVGLVVTVLSGTCSTNPQIRVDAIDGLGGVTAATITAPGVCERLASNPMVILTTDEDEGPGPAGVQFNGTFSIIPPAALNAVNLYDGLTQNGTYITALGTGTGGAGTYAVYPGQTVASQPMASNSYTFIADGFNHWGATSEYTAIPWPLDLPNSFLANSYINTEFRSATASTSAWLGNTHHHRFINSYFLTTGGDHNVDLYSSYRVNNRSLHIDGQFETNTTAYAYYLTGPNRLPHLPDFRASYEFVFPNRALFKTAPGITTAQMPNASIQMPHSSLGFKVAATPAVWWANGDYLVQAPGVGYTSPMNIANWTGGRGQIESPLAGRTSSPLGDEAIVYSKWGLLSHTGDLSESCLVSVPLPLLNANDTIEVNVLAERTLGGGRPATDEVNVNVILQANGGCTPGTPSTGGVVVHKAVLNSATAATANIIASVHNAGDTAGQVFFVNSAPGGIGVSGSPISTAGVVTISNMDPAYVMVRCQSVTNATNTCGIRGATIKIIPGKS